MNLFHQKNYLKVQIAEVERLYEMAIDHPIMSTSLNEKLNYLKNELEQLPKESIEPKVELLQNELIMAVRENENNSNIMIISIGKKLMKTKEQIEKELTQRKALVKILDIECKDLIELNLKHIKQLEQELVELEKPKYTAKDFPCLDFIFDILYHDGTYEYEIQRNGNKRITKNGRMSISYIDENVNIIPCTAADIEVGDYFALIDGDNNIISNYRYCTEVEGNSIYIDYGDDGYIGNNFISRNGTDSYVKFKLKGA